MRNAYYMLLFLSAVLSGCSMDEKADPYERTKHVLDVTLAYPEGYDSLLREGVEVRIENTGNGSIYTASTDGNGRFALELSNGIYRITVSDRADGGMFNGRADRINLVDRDQTLTLSLMRSVSGDIVFKEIYNGGCPAYPLEGTYQFDKYVILHNNTSEVQYLDGLCFGTADPYNSQGTNVWVEYDQVTGEASYPDFVPIVQVIWQFPGGGTDFPLQPGEDAVVVCCGAIDHTVQYPMSVNLDREGYFVCYNNVYFPNTKYHPAPGPHISSDRYLDVVLKMGQANAFTFSVFSPAPVIFRAEGMTVREFLNMEGSVIQKPGSTVDRIACIPIDWIIDGVDVFYGGSTKNVKRLQSQIDAGYVTLSDNYLGHSLYRHVDESATADMGFEVLMDSNNSSNDFYERDRQSLYAE
ncbi:MAG TPA: DUF4876 domain-containing protein [Candidatus Coprenecus stercoravium]|uniref:DUF4876 domain-containing protein n=1 Tax=Candidatus Coprenecus stercoravium TaxID=2840735 RepID=A0A9D2KB08_9BACT|nr:DUF4876 domain-containing protein [Candidatus Coprenecus stercoravium]